jgi:hypothetical protein
MPKSNCESIEERSQKVKAKLIAEAKAIYKTPTKQKSWIYDQYASLVSGEARHGNFNELVDAVSKILAKQQLEDETCLSK